MLERLRVRHETVPWLVAGVVLAVVVGTPLIVSGPGNDLDVGNVLHSGRSIARDFSYLPSRAPGSPVHETIVGVLDRLGGTVLTNVASVVAAAILIVALDRLLRREGLGPGARWAVALVAANPWFLIAATSTTDYLFALAFVVGAANALRSHRPILAGILAAAAMGCRIGSATLIAALLLAELTERSATRRGRLAPDRREDTPTDVGSPAESHAAPGVPAGPTHGAPSDATSGPAVPRPSTGPTSSATAAWDLVRAGSPVSHTLIAGLVTAVATALLFIPSYLEAGGLSFAQNDFSTSSPLVQLGRAAVKDMTLLGPVATVVALFALPALLRAVRGWQTSWLVRFAVPGLVLSQLLFVRFPWKVPHLLPSLLCGAVLLAVALAERPRLLVVLVALQLVFAVVQVDLIAPDDPNQATAAELDLGVSWGPVVTDWQCRRQDPDAYLGRQKVEIERAWNCARPFGTGPD